MPRVRAYAMSAPRAWLFLAFLGVWLYAVAQILKLYQDVFARATGLDPQDVPQVLGIFSGLGSLLFLAGLVAALWRANLAAGLSAAGVRGLVLGAAGVGVLIVFEVALILVFVGLGAEFARELLREGARTVGDVFGNALAFAGLASLGVGLAQATSLFRHPGPPARTGDGTKETAESR